MNTSDNTISGECQQILNNLTRQVILIGLIAIAFLMPFYREIIPPLIVGVSCLSVLYLCVFKRNQKIQIIQFYKSPKIVFFSVIALLQFLYFLVIVIGCFYSKDVKASFLEVERNIFFILIPVCFFQAISFSAQKVGKIIAAFISGNFSACILCFAFAVYNSISIINGNLVFDSTVNKNFSAFNSPIIGGNYFYYTDFSLFHHPTYFSLYLAFSLVLIFWMLGNKRFTRPEILYLLVAALVFLVTLYFLSSRIVLVGTFIISLVASLQLLIKIDRWQVKSFAIACICCLFVVTTQHPRFKLMAGTVNVILSGKDLNAKTKDSFAVKIQIWKAAIGILKQNPVLGVGTSDAQSALMSEYLNGGLIYAHSRNLNAHNQYLETWLRNGVFGIATLFAILIFSLVRGFLFKNVLLAYLTLLLMVSFTAESVLVRQGGIVFFSFFLSLLSLPILFKRKV